MVRAARYGFPLTLAIIGGDPQRFVPYVELYYRALAQLGQPTTLPVGVHSPGHIADTLPHEAMLRSIELYGREVMPRVRELVDLAGSPATAESLPVQ